MKIQHENPRVEQLANALAKLAYSLAGRGDRAGIETIAIALVPTIVSSIDNGGADGGDTVLETLTKAAEHIRFLGEWTTLAQHVDNDTPTTGDAHYWAKYDQSTRECAAGFFRGCAESQEDEIAAFCLDLAKREIEATVVQHQPDIQYDLSALASETVTSLAMLRAAYGLLGDGVGAEWKGDSSEYTRGQVELISDLIGLGLDDKDAVLALIRQAGEAGS